MWSHIHVWLSQSLVIFLLYLFDSFQLNILDLQLYGIFYSISLIEKRQVESSVSPHQFQFHVFQVLCLHFIWVINSNKINLFLVTPWYLSVGFVVIICFFPINIEKTNTHICIYACIYVHTCRHRIFHSFWLVYARSWLSIAMKRFTP